MTSVICFRCHDHPAICADRVELLSRYNPGMPIVGLFGGAPESAHAIREALGDTICHWYETGKPPEWNWQHADLAVRSWYKDHGHKIDFDRLYLIEWDLILLDSLQRLYSHVPPGAIAVTALCPLIEVAHDWSWTIFEPYMSQWAALLAAVREEYGYDDEPFASLGPGTCYSRIFLDQYCKANVPELSADELRVPLFAQCFDIPVFDTNFLRSWGDPEELRFFNCRRMEISTDAILASIARPDGKRVFHPYTQPFAAIAAEQSILP